MEESQSTQIARDAFAAWQQEIQKNIFTTDTDLMHTIQYHFPKGKNLISELEAFGSLVPTQLEMLVKENNLAINLPHLEAYDSLGNRIDKIIHHPAYVAAGDIIYGTQLLGRMSKPGGLLECLSFLFLSSQVGEAGHNCPIACSAGIIRVLQKIPDFKNKKFYLDKLTASSYKTNFTGAQFLTEIQGGSDVGLNATYAKEEGEHWRIYGEKWFCSNVGADLIFTTARYDLESKGTQGLGLFLVPAIWAGKKNHYTIRRLKDKIGTRSMATGEIDYHGTYALLVGTPEDGFRLVMNNVLHLSRLFNSFCVLGMARRAYSIAQAYAKHRIAFGHAINEYPLMQETLARIKAENSAMLAAIFATGRMQDQFDLDETRHPNHKLLLRLLVNMQKYLSARWSVEHIHHTLDVLAGNGTIETFSPIPRLLRDCIVCENWEGTHHVLRTQVLKDLYKFKIDEVYLEYMESKIAEFTQPDPRVRALADEIKKFRLAMQNFYSLDKAAQTLQIQFIVDKMSILFCALMLLIEAFDQQTQSSSKLDCYDYFFMHHINKNEIVYDDKYIQLCNRIIA